MTIHWKAVEQYFTVVLFVFRFYLVCNFGIFVNFGLGTVRSERVKVVSEIFCATFKCYGDSECLAVFH